MLRFVRLSLNYALTVLYLLHRCLPEVGGVKLEGEPVTLGEWFTEFVEPEFPRPLIWTNGAQFAVRKDMIRRRPLESYKKMLQNLSQHVNPIVGHYCERSWFYITNLHKRENL